jgi:hypothetical protein
MAATLIPIARLDVLRRRRAALLHVHSDAE